MAGPLPQRHDPVIPDWWKPYAAEFPKWVAWLGMREHWVRLPGTLRSYHAADPADLAEQIRAANVDANR
jgi:hypothetical protein